MISRCLLASAALALSSCATGVMDGVMESWTGEHIDAVVQQWGYPNAEREFRGRKLYVWNNSRTVVMPSTTTYSGTVARTGPGTAQVYGSSSTVVGGTIQGSCERLLEVDDRGVVVSWQWQGNDCCVMTIAGPCAKFPNPRRLPR